ncbi:MAG: DUF1893 domain-containing protein [Erysipelotrichaceae bacterium]|nr:DUF1893 domain-containing protein [Erysipelotrichaceae bacterium]
MNLKQTLLANNYSIIASNGYYSLDSGIKPVISKIKDDKDYFSGLEVVDKIVGKASAMLLVYSGVSKVYALVLSLAGKQILDKYNIEYQYDELVPYIINRRGDGMCPMEITVKDIDDLKDAYDALLNKVYE